MSIEIALGVVFLMIVVVWGVLAPASDIEIAVKRSKALEDRLEREFGATGDGLGKKANSLRGKIPSPISDNLDKIVKMRNDIVHQKNHDHLLDRRKFIHLCDEVENQLNSLKPPGQIEHQLLGCLVYLIMAVMAYAGLANMY